MPSFTLGGVTYEYLRPPLSVAPQEVHSWEYGHWPKMEAAVPLVDGGEASVHGQAMRWAGEQVLVRWQDDEGHYHDAWLAAVGVRRLTPSEADVIDFHASPPEIRSVRWRDRLPGFLPE